MIERKYHYETIEGKKKRVYEDTPTCEQGTQEELDQMKRNIERGYGYFQEIKEKENNDVGVTTTNAKEGEYLTIDMQDTQHRIYEVKDKEATLLPQEEASKIIDDIKSDLKAGHKETKQENILDNLLENQPISEDTTFNEDVIRIGFEKDFQKYLDDLPTTQLKVKHNNHLFKKLSLSLLLFILGIFLGYGLAYLLGLLIAR